MVTAVCQPSRFATVRVVPHSVALGQQRALTVQLQNDAICVAIGVLPVSHPNLSDDMYVPGRSDSALFNGCSWYTFFGGRGYFYYGGKCRFTPVGFGSGDEVSAVVDRLIRNDYVNDNGVVRFLRNGKALEMEPLPVGFAEEAVLVVSFGIEGGSAKVVCFE